MNKKRVAGMVILLLVITLLPVVSSTKTIDYQETAEKDGEMVPTGPIERYFGIISSPTRSDGDYTYVKPIFVSITGIENGVRTFLNTKEIGIRNSIFNKLGPIIGATFVYTEHSFIFIE